MLLPRLPRERPTPPWPVLLALAAAAAPRADVHAALASAAGTLFEAAPFVLAAAVLPRRYDRLLEAAGCGCGRRGIPGALSLPATALCWLAFGPWIALLRSIAALVIARVALGRVALGRGAGTVSLAPMPDPFAELSGLVVPTILASLAAQVLAAHATGTGRVWPPLIALAGALLGSLVPCATAGVAIAAGLAHPLPSAAAGILISAGLWRLRPESAREIRDTASRPAAFASVLLAVALAALVWRGPAGLVNPRLLPFDAVGAGLALAGVRSRRTAVRGASALGAGLVCALAAGYAVPQTVASETTLATAWPGQAVDFTGVAYVRGPTTVLQRFAITCCRLDASAVAVRLTRRFPYADGTWVAVHGTFVRAGAALLVRPERAVAVPAPADPFVYR